MKPYKIISNINVKSAFTSDQEKRAYPPRDIELK